MQQDNPGCLRDPIWQFIGVLLALLALVFSVFIWLVPNHEAIFPPPHTPSTQTSDSAIEASPSPSDTPPQTSATKNTLPQTYYAKTPGPGCDTSSGHWTLNDGNITCEANGTAFTSEGSGGESTVKFDWPQHPFPQAYTMSVIASNINPTTCIAIIQGYYSLGACALGDVTIIRYDQSPIVLAAKHFANTSTYFQITAKVSGPTLSLTVYSSDNGDTIDLTATDSTYARTDSISLVVYTVNTTPASATLSEFRYTSQV